MGIRHLSQIQEELDSREHSTSFLPPTVQQQQQQQQQRGGASTPGDVEAEEQEGGRLPEPASPPLLHQQKKPDENRSLLEELAHIEAELRESLRLDEERQQKAEFLRQHENKLLWQNLCYLSLSQRVAKPWVSSYFRRFPMHIYCLPVQDASHRGRRRGQRKRR
ncbi:uncharacterized protein PAE49_009380 [Odontesthes bonariensis]